MQDYVHDPLLIDPRVISVDGAAVPENLEPRKVSLYHFI